MRANFSTKIGEFVVTETLKLIGRTEIRTFHALLNTHP